MKSKFILSTIFTLSLLLATQLATVSCSKDLKGSLASTSWEKDEDGGVVTLDFSTKTALLTDIYGGVKSEYTYTYTYTYPTVSLSRKSEIIKDESDDATSGATTESMPTLMTGKVSGNKLTLTNQSTGKTFLVLTRQ
jgi:hypothetical protein